LLLCRAGWRGGVLSDIEHGSDRRHQRAGAAINVTQFDGQFTAVAFSNMLNAQLPDLEISFGGVIAFASYEEPAHRWNDTREPQPKLQGEWEGFTFPCSIIDDSASGRD
jgi:hypothetical protein